MRFTFGILCFNHEKYIIEHLESIKYQVIKYRKKNKVDLILIDDFSSDKTFELAKLWLEKNKKIFKKITCKKNKKNLKTCKTYTKICRLIGTKKFKISASDDVYSYVNIFKECISLKDFEFRSYKPILLYDSDLKIDLKLNFLIYICNAQYKSFYERVRGFPSLNTPNTLFSYNFIKKREVLNFINYFEIVEDWPFWLAISKYFSVNFYQKYSTILYYRRTNNSAFLIKSNEFKEDKKKILDNLIKFEKNKFKKILYRSRKKFYFSTFKIIFDLNYILFVLVSFANFFPILKKIFLEDYFLSRHQKHYDLIKHSAKNFKIQV